MILLTVNPLLLLALTSTTEISPAEVFIEPTVAEAPAVIAQADDAAEDPKWTGSANVGAVLNSGNTESVAIAASIDAELRREKDRHSFGLYWNYAENDDSTTGVTSITERKAGGDYQYDYFINEKTFYLATAGAKTDSLALLDLRWYAGVGVGRQFHEEEDLKLSGDISLIYLEESYKVSADDSEGVAARLSASYFKRLSETTVIEINGEIAPSLKDSEDIYGRLDTRIKVDVNENLFAQLQWIIDWDNSPASGTDRTDQQILATLGWGF